VITAWSTTLKGMPIWAFHGAKDDLVPIGGQQGLVDALKNLGNDVSDLASYRIPTTTF
jgi:predicted esterase